MKVWIAAIRSRDGKNCAVVLEATDEINLAELIKTDETMTTASICKTKKEAETVVDFWNSTYRENGTFEWL